MLRILPTANWSTSEKAQSAYVAHRPTGFGFALGECQGKRFKLEIYDRTRYFAITGHDLPGTPTTLEPREAQLRELHARVWSADLLEILKLFGLHKRDRGKSEWTSDAHGSTERLARPRQNTT